MSPQFPRHPHPVTSLPVRFSAFIAVTVMASACEDRPERFVERADSAGVEIVRNIGGDRLLRWRFEEHVRVSEGLPGGALHLGWGQVGADSLGRLFVLDPASQRVAVFDSSGSFLHSIGGGGSPAGGLDTPVSLTVRPDGAVAVFDIGLARILEFSVDGRVVSQRPLAAREWGWRVESVLGGFVGVRRPEPSETDDTTRRVERLVAVTTSDTLELASLAHETATFTLPACGWTATAEPLFSPRLVWDAMEALVAVTAEVDYVVNWFSTAGQTRSIRRMVPARLTNDSAAAMELDGGLSVATPGGTCDADPSNEIRQRGFAPVLPAVYGIALAPDSTMWVVRGHFRAEDPVIDVFTKSGVYLGTLPPGSPTPIGFTPSGRMLAVDRRGDRRAELVAYAIDRRR